MLIKRVVQQELARQAATPLRPPVPPGEEGQVDYGFLGSWSDPATNKVRRVWAFVLVLSCSRHMFVRPVLRLDQAAFVAAHVAAFAFFGGAPRRLVPDNLATGVDRSDLYDPKLNRAYADLAAHYQVLIDPARVRRPKDKPRVERQMPYVRDSLFRGRQWRSEAEMQERSLIWCEEVAGKRHHRGLDGARPLEVFHALEAAALVPLPAAPFELCTWSSPKVGADCHVRVGGALYSLPWRFIAKVVDCRTSERLVEFFVDGELVRTWTRIHRGRQTNYDDYPPERGLPSSAAQLGNQRRRQRRGAFLQAPGAQGAVARERILSEMCWTPARTRTSQRRRRGPRDCATGSRRTHRDGDAVTNSASTPSTVWSFPCSVPTRLQPRLAATSRRTERRPATFMSG